LCDLTDHPLYSAETTALLLAMTALQRADGVVPAVALENALQARRDHTQIRGNNTWEYEDIVAVVARLTT
jgi:hypothetical protein